ATDHRRLPPAAASSGIDGTGHCPARSRCPGVVPAATLAQNWRPPPSGYNCLGNQRRDQLALLGSGDDAGAFSPFTRHGLINLPAPGCPSGLTIQAVIWST